MGQQVEIYGMDIETDTALGGVDPTLAPIRTIALSSRGFDETYTGDEAGLLRALDERLAGLPAGILATWNGATFDLPYIADRARILGVDLDLQLCLDRRLTLRRAPLPGHGGAYRGAWGHHAHLDTFRLYGESDGPARSSLRNLGRLLGVGHHGHGSCRTDDLLNEALHAHAASDARLARVLAERRRQAAHRLVDHLAPEEAAPVEVAALRLARRDRRPEGSRQPAVAGI